MWDFPHEFITGPQNRVVVDYLSACWEWLVQVVIENLANQLQTIVRILSSPENGGSRIGPQN